MKKLLAFIMSMVVMLSLSMPAFASEINHAAKNTSFEITLDEILAKADPKDIHTENGITSIPVTLDVNDEVYTEIVIRINGLTRASAKSFSMEGWFRLTSTKEIVTVYGLDGTFEYTGAKATITGASSYHNSCMSGWTGASNINKSSDDDGSATITANYTVSKDGVLNNNASCSAKCTKSGTITFSGNYDESTII